MSELMAYPKSYVYDQLGNKPRGNLYYLKYEADKVIADKDAKILALDAEVFKEKHHAKLFFDERNYAETQLRQQKFKRCLDKAKWCDERIARYTLQQDIQGISWQKEIKFYRRLKDKFIEISKRFEDPKPEASND